MKDWIREDIKAISAYHVQDASGMLKLDAMENPYGWPEPLKQKWLEAMAQTQMNRYPDPSGSAIKEKLRAVEVIDEQYEILLGNGSDEIIQIVAMCMGRPGDVILSPLPSFVMFKMISTFTEKQFIGVPLLPDFSLDLDAMLRAIDEHQPAVIFLAQPNNPTGNLYSKEAVEKVIQAAPGLVILDEAYRAFTDANGVELLAKYDNLAVMRTLSKVGLAGLRLGYLIGHRSWLDEFEKVRLPYNINVLTQASVAFALDHYDVLQQQADTIKQQRALLMEALQNLSTAEPFSSEANFILCRFPQGKANTIFEALKQRQILVKNLHGSHPLLDECLRFTVGAPNENQQLIAALQEIVF